MVGMHRSPYHGFSVEFSQHRQYAPGDDLRYLDWKVYGRADKLYLKQYQKETNLDLVLLVDGSGSMAYGSVEQVGGQAPTKYDFAAGVAAALAFVALRQQDRVALVLFADSVRANTRTSNAHGHWQSLVELLAAHRPVALRRSAPVAHDGTRGTDLDRLFEQVLAKLTQRSLIVLVSDLFDDAEALQRGLARAQFNRHDMIVLQTMDPAELTFPFRRPARFVGLEDEGELGLDPSALRQAYLAAMQDHTQRVQEIARRFHFDHLLLDSSKPVGAPLGRFLARRAAHARRGK